MMVTVHRVRADRYAGHWPTGRDDIDVPVDRPSEPVRQFQGECLLIWLRICYSPPRDVAALVLRKSVSSEGKLGAGEGLRAPWGEVAIPGWDSPSHVRPAISQLRALFA